MAATESIAEAKAANRQARRATASPYREDRGFKQARTRQAFRSRVGCQNSDRSYEWPIYRRNGVLTPHTILVAGPALVGVSRAAGTSLLPHSVEQGIARNVPRPFAYVPGRAPVGWQYHAWDMGRETPGLFPRGRGLNIW